MRLCALQAKSTPEVINALTPVGVKCFLAQLLDIGYFHSHHADPMLTLCRLYADPMLTFC